MRTSVDIPDDLFRQLKAYAALQGLKMKEVIERALRNEVDPSAVRPSDHRVTFPIIPASATGTITAEQVERAVREMAEEEEKDYARFMRRERPTGTDR